ncbi:hypothetical protein BKA65DRAFT_245769 [Rhexocercosporidium sp. MPI-PUGE-AT-0058]|nr:hypothetical protein BKA65DRAFT_245769 [Rhexocercosporidium sp. MPI-PUGE-AT-0058]
MPPESHSTIRSKKASQFSARHPRLQFLAFLVTRIVVRCLCSPVPIFRTHPIKPNRLCPPYQNTRVVTAADPFTD